MRARCILRQGSRVRSVRAIARPAVDADRQDNLVDSKVCYRVCLQLVSRIHCDMRDKIKKEP